jgi:hypothetical protein
METGAYRESAQLIDDGRDIQAELAMSLEVIAENIHSSVASSVIEEPKTTVKENAENIQGQAPVDLDSIARTKRDGEHFIFEDKIYLAHKVRYTLSGEPANEPYTLVETKLNSKLEEVPLKETEIARLKGLIKVAEVTNALRTMQINLERMLIPLCFFLLKKILIRVFQRHKLKNLASSKENQVPKRRTFLQRERSTPISRPHQRKQHKMPCLFRCLKRGALIWGISQALFLKKKMMLLMN